MKYRDLQIQTQREFPSNMQTQGFGWLARAGYITRKNEPLLMHIAGREMDTRAKAEELYNSMQNAGISVLFDDRDERAGIKFNDADLIGCPIRVTVGGRNLREGMVELKERKVKENKLVQIDKIIDEINDILK